MIFGGVINYMRDRVGLCEKSEEFMDKYLLNAVLSYIEEREQELILSMRYDEWVNIDRRSIDEIRDNIVEYINRFSLACRGSSLDADEIRDIRSMLSDDLILRALCELYVNGIYGNSYSKYIIMKDVPPEKCVELRSESLSVRSRFIEIAKDLYLVKRRFPDKSTFEAPYLVDRVFAYAEPRYIPLGKIPPSSIIDEIKDCIAHIYELYNTRILERKPRAEELRAVLDVLIQFFNDIETRFKIKFYEYQVEGLKRVLESIIIALRDEKVSINIIEAPTGSGKTEIFVLTTLILALIKRISIHYAGIKERANSPIAILVYPRQALASNQIDRLLKYLRTLNKKIEIFFRHAAPKPLITMSINYGEVRYRHEYEELVRKHLHEVMETGYREYQERTSQFRGRIRYALRYDEESSTIFLELKYFKCPDGHDPALLYDLDRNELVVDEVICGTERLPYLRIVKEIVRERPGDVHVTLFESLRLNLLTQDWVKIFGCELADGLITGPLLLILDEIHTYVDIPGARYAYILRRVMARITERIGRRGFVIIGVSATIPNPDEFLRDLFLIDHGLTKSAILNYIRPKDSEVIPLGNEYFFLVVPTTKYLVDFTSVSIQAVMTLFYNIPALPDEEKLVKKAFVFVDDLNVIRRFKHDLSDALHREDSRAYCVDRVYGLQDLRNIWSSCFRQTIHDFGDTSLRDPAMFRVDEIYRYNSWRNGELWWGYSLEAEKGLRFDKVEEYSSKYKGKISEASIVVTTSALEVGVDYRDVVLIYQHGMPPNLSALIQRAGRAGRRIFENPLTRTIVAAQLSPEIPTQSAYFRIFTTVRSLREALEYDRLYVPTRNREIITQSIVETLLDYLIHLGRLSERVDENRVEDFECNEFLMNLVRTLSSKREANRLLRYLEMIFPWDVNEIKEIIEKDVVDYIRRECERMRR